MSNIIKDFFSGRSYYLSIKTHLLVILILGVTLIFSFLPVMISSAIHATENNINLKDAFLKIIFADAMFLYCSSFIAPFIILSIKVMYKERMKDFILYPIALLGSFYVVIFGALMYSGVVSRNLFSLGESASNNIYPTIADISIMIITLIIWYYCMYKESYFHQNTSDSYQRDEKKNFVSFDEVIKK
ncbi:hypothetical protein [uncultured Shewanella sp.]|uniref:hypothetical protein n=1 Tax=uncultured Shewanella sp. TaxID=173975 RepID=UPI0026100E75|nr:hypothetical protein [uncultured Shewanella sp.]